jgi:hypothetical protein
MTNKGFKFLLPNIEVKVDNVFKITKYLSKFSSIFFQNWFPNLAYNVYYVKKISAKP